MVGISVLSGNLPAQDTLLYFSWDNSVTQPDISPAGKAATTASPYAKVSPGGAKGTNGLNPGKGPANEVADLNLSYPYHRDFDVVGVDVSYDYQRDEAVGTILSRGNGFVFGQADRAYVKYRVENGNGGYTEVVSGSYPYNGSTHVLQTTRFTYNPLSGSATLTVDGVEMWTNPVKTPGRGLVWEANTPFLIGTSLDATGNNRVILDNLVFARFTPAASPALPVELTYFEANRRFDGVELSWETTSEVDNAYFSVERSDDAATWRSMLSLPGAGNTSLARQYSAVDYVPLTGPTYYRLRQVDYDGTATYSAVRTVRAGAAASAVSAAPNPASDHILITGAAGPFKLVDTYGRQAGRLAPVRISETAFRLDVSALTPGNYYLLHPGGAIRVVKL
ncbi:hypothetical protein [Lewinella sp. IMCC34183]|uniref:hypothetical protein n=1 Tax=Lewinella sp. IMCC34183 TaxID=2248762 RepID=UPI000E27A036|nr:hypothetical protein [Lewinella sp. IMCC34183]